MLDTVTATEGLLVEAWGWSCLGVMTALGVSSLESELPEATDTTGMNSGAAGSRSWGWLVEGCWGLLGLTVTVGWTVATSTWAEETWLGSTTAWLVALWAIGLMEAVWVNSRGGLWR